MLGQLFARTGQWDQAKEHLVAAYAVRKETALTLAAVAAIQNDEPTSSAGRAGAEIFQGAS